MIVCIEGMDAVGKATQSKLLAEHMKAGLFTFPEYDTPAGKLIKQNLKDEWVCMKHAPPTEVRGYVESHEVNAYVLQSLMLVNRLEMAGAMLGSLAVNKHLVLDRYDASAMVYGSLEGVSASWLELTNKALPVRPDLYILLDAPVEVGFQRRPERRDRLEKDRAFLERVREGYLRLFADRQKAHVDSRSSARWVVVDATGTVEEVASAVWTIVEGTLS